MPASIREHWLNVCGIRGMRRRLLLAVIPVALALAGCSGQVQPADANGAGGQSRGPAHVGQGTETNPNSSQPNSQNK
jgi:hypothetical protein